MLVDQRLMQRKAAILGLVFGGILIILGISTLYISAAGEGVGQVFGIQFLSTIIIPVIIAVLLCLRLRKQVGGFWTFREATSGIFLLFFVAFLSYSVGKLIYTKTIDTQIEKTATEKSISITVDMLSKQNIPTDKIDEIVKPLEQQLEMAGKFSPGWIAQGMLSAIVIIFLGSLLFAAIFKREEAVFDQDQTL